MNTITMSAVIVTLFFGGPDGYNPFGHYGSIVMPIAWFLIKVIAFCYFFVWLRGALPRMRYDKLMDLGWKRLIPASLGWLLIVAGFMINGWWGVGLALAVIAAGLGLARAFSIGGELESRDQAILPPVGRRPISPRLLRRLTDGDPEGGGQ
jgi:NADH-quinone oxidoreductase subunit H